MTQVHECTSQTPVDAMSSGETPASLDSPEGTLMLDIEHVLVEDDPRIWSNNRKVSFLLRNSECTNRCA